MHGAFSIANKCSTFVLENYTATCFAHRLRRRICTCELIGKLICQSKGGERGKGRSKNTGTDDDDDDDDDYDDG